MNPKLTLATLLVATSLAANAQSTFNGNGNTGFGGPVGNGNLVVSENGVNITFTLNTTSALGANDLVLYLDTVAGGFSSTAGFNDAADGGRKAVSGYTPNENGGGSGQSVLTFASGFTADYALGIGNGYASLFTLANGGNNSLTYNTGASQGGASPYSLTVSLASLGLTAGQSFNLFGTLISESGYRSSETVAGNATGTQGWNPYTQTSFGTFTIAPVPEPATVFLGLSGVATFILLRRRTR